MIVRLPSAGSSCRSPRSAQGRAPSHPPSHHCPPSPPFLRSRPRGCPQSPALPLAAPVPRPRRLPRSGCRPRRHLLTMLRHHRCLTRPGCPLHLQPPWGSRSNKRQPATKSHLRERSQGFCAFTTPGGRGPPRILAVRCWIPATSFYGRNLGQHCWIIPSNAALLTTGGGTFDQTASKPRDGIAPASADKNARTRGGLCLVGKSACRVRRRWIQPGQT